MFQLESVSLRGNDRWRLHQISLSFQSAATAVIGYSGAGKSSLLNLLVGFERPDAGRIQRPDAAISSAAGAPSARLPFFWVPQTGGLWPHLSVRQHLQAVQPEFLQNSPNLPFSADEILDRFALSHLANSRPAELSPGETSRLAAARGLAAAPAWLIMDEPLSHVDPVRKPAFWQAIRELAGAAGSSLIFSCHEPEVVLRQASLAVCLRHGEIWFSGTVRELYLRPSCAELGRFLGPLNWWTPAEATALTQSPSQLPADSCIRPHQVLLQPAATSSLQVLESQNCGLYHETRLQPPAGAPVTVLHQHSDVPLQPGVSVAISLRGVA